ncbi:MAG TPA: HEAT repeat domain-containing protein [Candidatus Sericytochromatia bacterium]
MSNVLEQATAAAQQGDWSLLNQCLQQLPLGDPDRESRFGKNATDRSGRSVSLSDRDLDQVLKLALDVLNAGDFQERWDVAKVIPKLGERAIAPLIEILQDDAADLELRWFAIRILSGFNHPSVIATLVDFLKTVEDEDLAAMASATLSSLGDGAIEALSSLLSEPESRLLATKSLAQIRRPRVITPLLGVVGDSQVAVRATAVEALSSFQDPRIIPVLLEGLNDLAAAVRKEAVIGLGLRADLGGELDLLAQLKPRLYDFNQDVCQQAAIALGRLGTDEAALVLFNVLMSPVTPVLLQIDLIRALSWVGTAKTLDYLQQALTITSVECVLEIVRVLGRVEKPELKAIAAQILLDFLNSQHPHTSREAVKQAIALSWGELKEVSAVEALVGLLADPAMSVRLHAIAALKNFPTAYQQLEQLADEAQLAPALKEGVAIALSEWQV